MLIVIKCNRDRLAGETNWQHKMLIIRTAPHPTAALPWHPQHTLQPRHTIPTPPKISLPPRPPYGACRPVLSLLRSPRLHPRRLIRIQMLPPLLLQRLSIMPRGPARYILGTEEALVRYRRLRAMCSHIGQSRRLALKSRRRGCLVRFMWAIRTSELPSHPTMPPRHPCRSQVDRRIGQRVKVRLQVHGGLR